MNMGSKHTPKQEKREFEEQVARDIENLRYKRSPEDQAEVDAYYESIKGKSFEDLKCKINEIPKVLQKEAMINKRQTHAIHKAVTSQVYKDLRELLYSDGFNGNFYKEFMAKYLEVAREDPRSEAAKIVAKTVFSEQMLKAMDEDANRDQQADIDFIRYRICKSLFDKQRAIFDDVHVRRKAIIASRRAGKTENSARMLASVAAIPNSPIFYINLTFQNAIDQLWLKTLEQLDAAGLTYTSSSSDGIINLTNGSIIHFKGNATKKDTEKMRGFSSRLVIIDECQSQPNLKTLVEDVIEPLLIDYPDSQLILQGTPPRVPNTYFEQIYRQYRDNPTPTTKAYNWSMLDNPFIPNVEEELNLICERKGVTREDSLILREFLGCVGTYDTEARVFERVSTFDTASCSGPDYSECIPSTFMAERYYVGVDYGWADYNSVIGLAINNEKKKAYVVYEEKFNKASVSDIVKAVTSAIEVGKKLILRNPQGRMDLIKGFCDTNENTISYEMSATYKLPIYKAWKYDKDMAIAQLREDIGVARVLIPKGGILDYECSQVLYERDSETDAITGKIDDKAFHPEAIMALLYASRQMYYEWGMEVGGEGRELK